MQYEEYFGYNILLLQFIYFPKHTLNLILNNDSVTDFNISNLLNKKLTNNIYLSEYF